MCASEEAQERLFVLPGEIFACSNDRGEGWLREEAVLEEGMRHGPRNGVLVWRARLGLRGMEGLSLVHPS